MRLAPADKTDIRPDQCEHWPYHRYLKRDANLTPGDGTFSSDCDPSRVYVHLAETLQTAAPSTLQYMQTYWKDIAGNDERLWEKQWAAHGTCISTLERSCYTAYQAADEAVDYFAIAVNLFQTLPSYSWLSDAGIVPSSSTNYTLSAIQTVLTSQFGRAVKIDCTNNELAALSYYFNVQGSVQSGTFQPAAGPGSTCPSTGIRYLPKPGTST